MMLQLKLSAGLRIKKDQPVEGEYVIIDQSIAIHPQPEPADSPQTRPAEAGGDQRLRPRDRNG